MRGRHEGSSIALTATEAGSAGCPARLDYAGRFAAYDAARGTVSDTGNDRRLLERGER